MKTKLKRYVRNYYCKKWVLFKQATLELQIPLSAIEGVAKDNGAYRVVRTSKTLTIFKHLSNYDLKEVYSYVV